MELGLLQHKNIRLKVSVKDGLVFNCLTVDCKYSRPSMRLLGQENLCGNQFKASFLLQH